MTITTLQIATTTIIAAATAGLTGIVSVISAVVSSRLSWRHNVRGRNPVGVVRHELVMLAGLQPQLAMQPVKQAAAYCRPSDAGFGSRPNYSVARQLVVS